MSALHKKLLREVLRMRGQVVTIALVVACGATTYLTMRSTQRALERSRDAYYERQRFADVFARVRRAPESLARDLAEIPGVAAVETRIVEDVALDVREVPDRAVARLISWPESGAPILDVPHLRTGRAPERPHEALLLESFAEANALPLGVEVRAIFEGRALDFVVTGTALSPEYVYPVLGAMPWGQEKRSAVLWVSRDILARALDMEGAFNDLTLRLARGASLEQVIDEVDRRLAPYGGTGAIGREDQASNRFVEGELDQLEVQASTIPAVFLLVAAFLLNVVLSRLVRTQRSQIASLKALGYSGLSIGLHYAELAALVVTLGTLLGTGLGAYLGGALTTVYARYFRFPLLEPSLAPSDVFVAFAVSFGAALAGTLGVVRSVTSLPAAEGMRAEPPVAYGKTLLERLGLARFFPDRARMILRELERRPLRAASSVLGVALAEVVLVIGLFAQDSVRRFVDLQFREGDRSDLSVELTQVVSRRALEEIARVPGVLRAEPTRTVPVRLRAGARTKETALVGWARDAELRRIVAPEGRVEPLPARGLALTPPLARTLDVQPGEFVTVELLEGERSTRRVLVTAVVEDMLGGSAYMELEALSELLAEAPSMTGAHLRVDRARQASVVRALEALPRVGSVSAREEVIEYFERSSGGMLVVFALILTSFSSIIAVGVVYNAARVTLAERSRDLATLRVLGFTEREISQLLLGELGALILLAIPLGLVLGRFLGHAMMDALMDPELFRIPTVIAPRTYLFSAVVVLASGAASAAVVRRRLARLDLVAVLKAAD